MVETTRELLGAKAWAFLYYDLALGFAVGPLKAYNFGRVRTVWVSRLFWTPPDVPTANGRGAWGAPVPPGVVEVLNGFGLTGYTCSFPNARNMEFVRSFVCVRRIPEGISKRGSLPPVKLYRQNFWNRSCHHWRAVNF